MAARLGQECRQRRRDAGLRQIDISTEAGVAEATISHFEAGRWWLRDTDRIVDAYAELLDTTPEAIWRSAIDRE